MGLGSCHAFLAIHIVREDPRKSAEALVSANGATASNKIERNTCPDNSGQLRAGREPAATLSPSAGQSPFLPVPVDNSLDAEYLSFVMLRFVGYFVRAFGTNFANVQRRRRGIH